MNLNIILAICRKDLLSSVKNKNILLVILTPVLLSMFSTSTVMLADNPVVSVALYDDGSNKDFIEYLRSVDHYNIIVTDSVDESKELFYKGEVEAFMVIPNEFSSDLEKDLRPSLNITVNPYNTKSLVFLQTYKDVIMKFAKQEYPVRISLETTPTGIQSRFNIPIWIMFAVVFVGISVLPSILTTEKEKKTLDAILVSPASEKDIIIGKSLFGLSLTILISLIILYVNQGLTGNILLMMLFIILGSAAFTGIGLLIASYQDSYSSASLVSTISMIPFILLALLADLSKEIGYISYLVPSTYILKGVKDAMLGSNGIRELYPEVLALFIFNILIYVLTVEVLKRKKHI